jgi:hypothetical protein
MGTTTSGGAGNGAMAWGVIIAIVILIAAAAIAGLLRWADVELQRIEADASAAPDSKRWLP